MKAEAVETINLNTFSSEKYSKKQCERVVFNLEVENEVVPVKAVSFPQLCSPISRNVDISRYPHLQGLNLADIFTEGNRTVDLVLGIDYYHTIVQGEVCKGGEGPIAVKSKLGWLLSGPVNSVKNDVNFTTNVISSLVLDVLPSRNKVENEDRELIESLNTFWKHESSGLVENEADNENQDDEHSTTIDIQ